jgi:hypothetical protein
MNFASRRHQLPGLGNISVASVLGFAADWLGWINPGQQVLRCWPGHVTGNPARFRTYTSEQTG